MLSIASFGKQNSVIMHSNVKFSMSLKSKYYKKFASTFLHVSLNTLLGKFGGHYNVFYMFVWCFCVFC